MRSVADRARVLGEWSAQGAALALLVWALVSAVRPARVIPLTEIAVVDSAQLSAWSTGPRPTRIHAQVDSLPSRLERDWLAALRRSGTDLSWSGELVPVAAAVEPVVAPVASEQVRIAAPTGSMVTVHDAAGLLDSARARSGGVVLTARTLVGLVHGSAGAGAATAWAAERVQLKPVVVLGRASWESKFVVAALEQEGWQVAARLSVAPGAFVEHGVIGVIDTARHAAVVVLDAAAAEGGLGGAIVRYARSGGGVVLAGDAATAAPFRSIAPGGSATYLPASVAAIPDSAPRRALSLHPVVLRSGDAVVLERRDARAAVVARRVALGRVLQVGYDDTWRWRMGGGDDAPGAHAAWWSSIVSAVAYAPRAAAAVGDSANRTVARRSDPAPFASLLAALGPASPQPAVVAREREGARWWLMPAIAVLLLVTWASRRLRGAP